MTGGWGGARLIAFASVIAVTAAAWLPGAALALFDAPVTLSTAGQAASKPRVAIDADGDALIVWRRFDGANFRIQLRARSAAGVLGPIQNVSTVGEDADDPQVAMNADGDAVIVWSRAGVIQARARSAAGVLGSIKQMGDPPFAQRPQVGIADNGDALIVWVRPDDVSGFGRVQARSLDAAGARGPIVTLSEDGRNASLAQVAVNATGQAVFAWQRVDDSFIERIQVRPRSPEGVFGKTQTLSKPGLEADRVQVGIAADGDAVAVWRRNDGNNLRIQASNRTGTNKFVKAKTLSKSGQDAGAPQVAMNTGGDAVFVWHRADSSTQNRIQAMRRSAAGVFSAAATLSGKGGENPEVAIADNSDAVVVWTRSDGAFQRIEARVRFANGFLGNVETISEGGEHANEPDVAMTGAGAALAVWVRNDEGLPVAQAAAGP